MTIEEPQRSLTRNSQCQITLPNKYWLLDHDGSVLKKPGLSLYESAKYTFVTNNKSNQRNENNNNNNLLIYCVSQINAGNAYIVLVFFSTNNTLVTGNLWELPDVKVMLSLSQYYIRLHTMYYTVGRNERNLCCFQDKFLARAQHVYPSASSFFHEIFPVSQRSISKHVEAFWSFHGQLSQSKTNWFWGCSIEYTEHRHISNSLHQVIVRWIPANRIHHA